DLGGGTFDVSLLETRDGLLRVVGHDGDNFLGGRDIDLAVVGWVIEQLAREGHHVDRADPEHAVAMRLLRSAAEEAKIELTRRAEATLQLPELLEIDGEPVDVDLVLSRAVLQDLMAPLVDKTVAVCHRLLARHGLDVDQLVKIVMVGGPTVIPFLRERVQAALPVPFAEQLDPMTLVARGAALYAATAGLDARPAKEEVVRGRRLWLQYPAMSSDLTPFVAGRLLDGPEKAPAEVRFVRGDDGFASEWTRFGTDGALVVMLELAPRKPNAFRIEGRDLQQQPIPVLPTTITVVQGMTVSDPPLSRSVGVALASDAVQVYLQRGTPLPAKRTFVHQTVETMSPAGGDTSLTIPIVQGELPEAHLCRLVGKLEIRSAELKGALAAGAEIEVTVEVDRGGRLSARALIPRLSQVFEQVARLVVPHADPSEMSEQLATLRARMVEARGTTDTSVLDRLFDVEWALQDAELALNDARGGDEDAAQKARRLLLDANAALDEIAEQASWPELDLRAVQRVASASRWVAQLGTEQEQRMLAEASAGVERARQARRAQDLERHLGIVRQLSSAAYYRHPDAWRWEFEHAASDIGGATDLAEAERLVREGRANIEDRNRLRDIVQRLWALVPRTAVDRSLGYGSGLR
ncbi:MAG: Hsp70 family protein, partial [Myxococcales bacterium]|nr:Hsp70 family protein [Myxococcales bacterium]